MKSGLPLVLSLLMCSVALAQTGVPAISSNGTVNAADYSRDIAPGGIISIFGTNLAAATAAASRLPLPTTLGGDSVEIVQGTSTQNLPLFFVSGAQINAQLPFNLTGGAAQVRVRNAGGASNSDTITILPRAPRLFTKTMDGKGEAIVLHADYTVVSATAPAKPGEIVILYLTGLGAVEPATAAGSAGGDGSDVNPLNLVSEGVSVTVGGRSAPVYYAGLAPYFAGLYQVNFQAPSEMLGGGEALAVSSGGNGSQANVSLACAANWQAIGSGSIGSGGGTVAAAGISLTAPAGAFASTTTVSMLRKPAPPASALDANRTSDFFAVSGLPDTISAPMTVKLDISRTVSSGGDALLMLQDVSGAASGPIFLPATVQGNQLVAAIPAVSATTMAAFHPADQPPPAAAGGVGDPQWVVAGVNSSGSVTNSTGNFVVVFYGTTRASASDLLAALDDAYSKLGALGLDWSKRTNKPIQVNLYPFTGDNAQKAGLETSIFWGRQGQQLDLNSTLMTDAATLRATAGHELFHLLQNLYDPRTLFQMAKFPSSWLWMLEALSTWFERVMTSSTPSNVKSFADFLSKHGLEYPPGDPGTVQDHGYGAAMFLEHISKQKGDSTAAGVIKLMAPGDGLVFPQPKNSPVDALNSVLGDVGAAWLQFSENYMAGSVYAGFPEPANVNSLATGNRARFLKETDAPVTFTWNAPDLSARVYSVAFDPAYQWPANTKLSVGLTDPGGKAEAIIYKMAGGTLWSSAGTARTTAWEYPDVSDLVKNHVSLIIMVANGHAVKPYSGATPLTLRVQIGAYSTIRSAGGGFTGGSCKTVTYRQNYPTETTFHACSSIGSYSDGPTVLSWNGNSFSRSWTGTTSSTTRTNSTSGTIEGAGAAVSVTVTDTGHYAGGRGDQYWGAIQVTMDWTYSVQLVSLPAVPFSANGSQAMAFGSSGAQTRNYVGAIKYSETVKLADGTLYQTTEYDAATTDWNSASASAVFYR